MTFHRYFQRPKGLLILVLGALAAIAAVGPLWRESLESLGVAIGVAMVLDGPILRFRKGHWVFPDGALLTGMIVSMVLARQLPWHVIAVTSAFAIVTKHIFRTAHANIFNPATLALFCSFFVYHTAQDWWGSMPEGGAVSLAILAGAGLFIAQKVHKLPLLVVFLAVYYLLFSAASFIGDPAVVAGVFRGADLRAVLYLAFFMVTDPPTSPPKPRDQAIFGVIAAIGCFVVREKTGAVYFLLAGLLLANLWEGWRRLRVDLRHRKPVAAAA